MSLRGRALELSGRPRAAARAWLVYAAKLEGAECARALREAARLSLAAGDEVGALFVCEYGRELGHDDALTPFAYEARVRLDLVPEDLGGLLPRQRLEHARELVGKGRVDEGRTVLAALHQNRELLEPALRVDVAHAYARSLAPARVDEAVGVLRALLEEVRDAELRRETYIVAGEIYESARRFEEAAEAYGGVL